MLGLNSRRMSREFDQLVCSGAHVWSTSICCDELPALKRSCISPDGRHRPPRSWNLWDYDVDNGNCVPPG